MSNQTLPDEPMYGLGDLALALGGSETSFTGQLLQLVAKADPENRELLRLAYPRQVLAWELWMQASPTPTESQLLSALAAAMSAPLPGLAQEIGHKDFPGRSFRELSECGLLWLINAVVFHPRGFALGLSMDTVTGEVTGWDILGDGREPWRYAEDMNERFTAAEATLVSYRWPDTVGEGVESR